MEIARIAAVIALIVGTTLGIQQAIYLFTPKTFFVCEAPLGDKSKIQLSDGTVVWLNAGSVLRYLNILIQPTGWWSWKERGILR